jgi:ATP-dependent helicase/nuclease subunit B
MPKKEISQRFRMKSLSEQIRALVQAHSFVSNFVRHSAHNAFIIHSAGEILEDCVAAIAQMVQVGKFRPKLSEVSFGEAKGASSTIGKYELVLSDGRVLSLDGKIDRIDIAKLDDEKLALVFDYKRRDKPFSWSKLYYGLDMQLPIYMLGCRNASDAHFKIQNVAGAFYMPVEVKVKAATLDELPKKTESLVIKQRAFSTAASHNTWIKMPRKTANFIISTSRKTDNPTAAMKTLRPSDFEKILKFTKKKIIQLAQEILSGKIDVKPYRLNEKSPCSFCDYKAVCRFDWQINDYNPLKSLRKPAALNEMEATSG